MKTTERFLKVPDRLFDLGLKPSAFYLYLYLVNTFYWKKTVRIKLSTLAEKCSLSIGTVSSALAQLEAVSLVKIRRRRHIESGFTITSEYELNHIGGYYSNLDKGIFNLLKDDKSALMVLCAVSFYKNKSNRAFPSYRQLMELTGLAKSTICAKINVLNATGALCRERYCCQNGALGHNNYVTISVKTRFFLFIFIIKKYGNFLVLFDSHEYIILPDGSLAHLKRCIFYVYICKNNARLNSSQNRRFFSFPLKRGSPKIDKPIINPLKLRKKLKDKD